VVSCRELSLSLSRSRIRSLGRSVGGLRRLICLSIASFALQMSACAPTVAPLALSDARLPAEARQSIADAQDELVVAEGRLLDAEADLARAQGALTRLSAAPPQLGGALPKLEAVGSERLALRVAERGYAAADLRRARARLELMYAQTALRYDLRVYELAPLEAAATLASREALAAREALRPARARLEEALSAWWEAYRALGPDAARFWEGALSR
jgi:hypothetical protein